MNDSRRHWIPVLLFYLSLWTGVFLISGRINEDPRWYDDRLIYDMASDLDAAEHTFLSTFAAYESDWSTRRFFPANIFYRVLLAEIFGASLMARLAVNILLAAVASLFFYLFLRRLNTPPLLRLCFPCLMLFGIASEAYLQLGYGEPWGMLPLALLCWLTLRDQQAKTPRERRILLLGCILTAVVLGLMKEAFLILLPSLSIFFLLLAYALHPEDSLWKILRRHGRLPLIYLLLCGALLLVARFRITAPQMAMVEGGLGSMARLVGRQAWIVLQKKELWIAGAGVLWLFALGSLYRKKTAHSSESWRHGVLLVVAGTTILLPQILLHARIGLSSGRYWLPLLFGSAFICVWVCREGLRRYPRAFLPHLALIVLFSAYSVYKSCRIGMAFAAERSRNAQFLQAIEKATPPGKQIVFAVRPQKGEMEITLTAQAYLKLQSNASMISIVGGKMVDGLYESPFRDAAAYHVRQSLHISAAQQPHIATIVVLEKIEDAFLKANRDWLDTTHWQRHAYTPPVRSWYRPVLYTRIPAPNP